MRAEVVLEDVGVKDNGAKSKVVQKYSLTHPRTKHQIRYFKSGGSFWGRNIKFELATKVWVCKKNSSCKFS
jgi:hypothetical protein